MLVGQHYHEAYDCNFKDVVIPSYPIKQESTSQIPLNPLPSERDVVLPIRDLIPSLNSALLNTVYTRLSEPVQAYDSSTADHVTRQPTRLTILEGYLEKNKAIPVSDLIPITRALYINERIDKSVWETKEYDCMDIWSKSFKNYEPMITVGKYKEMVQPFETEWNGLKLFGKTKNSLKTIAALASLRIVSENEVTAKLLLHYVAIVCWQFYTMERSRWLQIQMEKHEKFLEADIPSFFLYFNRYDIKKDPYPGRKEFKEAVQKDKLGDFARKYDFVTLFHCVMHHVMPQLNKHYFKTNNITDKYIKDFIGGKLFNNFFQLLHTSHFWTPYIENYDQHCIESVGSKANNVEHFKNNWMIRTLSKKYDAMKTCAWYQYHLGQKPQLNNTEKAPDEVIKGISKTLLLQVRVPIPHCHFHFSAEQAVFSFPKELKLKDTVNDDWEDIVQQCMFQDLVINQLARCMDQKTISECKTSLNSIYAVWKSQLEVVVPDPVAAAASPTKKKVRLGKRRGAKAAIPLEQKQEELQVGEEDVVMATEVHEDTNNKRKHQPGGEEAESSSSRKNRPVFHEPVKVNLIRARHSFYIDRETSTICTGLVPYLDWQGHWEIEPETSPNFIRPRVWEWLVGSGEDNLKRLDETIEILEGKPDEFYLETQELMPVLNVVKNEVQYVYCVKKEKVDLRRYTMDFDCVRHYFLFRNGGEVNNWFLLFHALIVLFRREQEAAAKLVEHYRETVDEKASNQQVLTALQLDYDQFRGMLKTDVYEHLKSFRAIDGMIVNAQQKWDRHSLALMTSVTWNRMFNLSFIKSYLKKELPLATTFLMQKQMVNCEYQSVDDVETVRIILNHLCEHLSTPGSYVLKGPFEWNCLQIAVPTKDGFTPYMGITDLNDYLISRFEPIFVGLSSFFQHLFPCAVIQHSSNRQHIKILEAQKTTPVALDMIYSLSKDINSEKFVEEVEQMVKVKQLCDQRREEFKIPELTMSMYAVVLFKLQEMDRDLHVSRAYQTNMENCSDKDRQIEMLKSNLEYICKDPIYNPNQRSKIQEQTNYLENSLTYLNSHKEMPQLILHIVNELRALFDSKQLLRALRGILETVENRTINPVVRTIIGKFKMDCTQYNNNNNNNNNNKLIAQVCKDLSPFYLMEQKNKKMHQEKYLLLKAEPSNNNNNSNTRSSAPMLLD